MMFGFPGNMLAHVAGENARILVIETAGGEADDDPNGFVFVEGRRLGAGSRCHERAKMNDAVNSSESLAIRFHCLLYLLLYGAYMAIPRSAQSAPCRFFAIALGFVI